MVILILLAFCHVILAKLTENEEKILTMNSETLNDKFRDHEKEIYTFSGVP